MKIYPISFPTRALYIDGEPDKKHFEGSRLKYVVFRENRIVILYYYLGKYKEALILRTGGETPKKGILPQVDGNFKLLVKVRMSRVDRLKKWLERFKKAGIKPDSLPDSFYQRLNVLLHLRRFNILRTILLYRWFKNDQKSL